jgi:hypothetical protein
MARQAPLSPPSLAAPTGLDPSWRPATYWPEEGLRHAILNNILGEVRHGLIQQALDSGAADIPPASLLSPEISPGLRDCLGAIHPSFMGGEYLPGYLRGEVEIARVALESTTADVIALRARKLKDGFIHYRVVDEYGTRYKCSPAHSLLPLTAGELLRTLEESGDGGGSLVMGPLIGSLGGGADPERLRGFVTVRSHFYPGLEQHCHERCEAYLDSLAPAEDDDEA